jgi:hypothetical protein
MSSTTSSFVLISAFYFVTWLMLIVIFLLQGFAQISGAAFVLFVLVKVLSSLQLTP